MTLHVKTPLISRIEQCLLAGLLLTGPTLAIGNDYPPPPGAYRSEPITLPSPIGSMDDTADTEQKTSNSADDKPGLLPLPLEETAPTNPYSSEVLFGTADPAASQATGEAHRTRPDFAVDFPHERSRGMPQGPGYGPRPHAPYDIYPPTYRNPQSYYAPGMSGYPAYAGPGDGYPADRVHPSAGPQPSYVPPPYDPGPPPQGFHPYPGDGSSDVGPVFRPPGQ